LKNLANGLGKGLQSFGKDVGELKADLREDRKEATNVMYRLLNNKRSEQLAKEALELDKKMKVFQIVQSEVGERKNDALKAAEFDFEKKKFNLNYLIELKKFDQAEKLSDNKIKASLKAAIINNKTISTPFMLGLIEPKEGYTMDTVDISDMNTYKFSQDGIDMAKDIADNTRTYRKTDPEREIANNKGKAVAGVGVVFTKPEDNDGTFQQKWDKNIQKDWVKNAVDNPQIAGETLLNQVRQYSDKGAVIDLSQIPYVDVKNYFTSNAIDPASGEEIPNSSPITLFPNLFKKETIDLSQGKS
jgi:azurin